MQFQSQRVPAPALVVALALAALLPGTAAAAPDFMPQLIKDGVGLGAPADPEILVSGDGTLYFTVGNIGSYSLWKSDGTTAGTMPVAGVTPYVGGTAWDFQAVVGNTLFLAATDSNGTELWKTDGTAAGTGLVKDIRPGGTLGGGPQQLVNLDSTLFFQANGGFDQDGLWKSDGSASGTQLVKQITFGSNDRMIPAGGQLFFPAIDPAGGYELWRSDGTPAGTHMVEDINPGTFSSGPTEVTPVGNIVYFTANDGSSQWRLWKSDGTAAGTMPVTGQFSSSPGIRDLTNAGGTLFFVASTPATGQELFKSDGTNTVLVKDIDPRILAPSIPAGAFSSSPSNLTNVSGTLYFIADDDTHGRELWKSDGTADGTQLVIDLTPGSSSTIFSGFGPTERADFTAAGDLLFFTISTPTTIGRANHSLYFTDGTADGTIPIFTIANISAGARPFSGFAFDGIDLYYRAATQFTPTGLPTQFGLFSIQVVPEPTSLMLSLTAFGAAIANSRRRRSRGWVHRAVRTHQTMPRRT